MIKILDTLKEYLVELGFEVDDASYGKMNKVINNVDSAILKFAADSVKHFALAGTAVLSFVATSTVGISKFIGSLAKADMQTDILARQLYTTKDNAVAFDSVLKAMGKSMQDLYMSPELMKNFVTLRNEALSMRAPKEYQTQMQFVRSIQLEFTKMKLEATYALQWIGYYFIKYMQGPITNIKNTLASINSMIVKTMPYWTRVIAQVMSWFAQMGVNIVRVFTDIGKGLSQLSELIPTKVKLIGAAILGLTMLLKAGPFGTFVAIFTAASLALDDFYSYLDGGESKLAPLWKKLIAFYNALKDSGAIDKFKNGFTKVMDTIQKGFDAVVKFFKNHAGDISNVFKTIGSIISWVVSIIVKMFENIGKVLEKNKPLWRNLIQIIKDFTKVDGKNPTLKNFIEWLVEKGIPGAINILLKIVDAISRVILWFDKMGLTGPIIAGVISGLLAAKLAMLALNAATKAGAIIKTISGLWKTATTVIGLLRNGIKLTAIAQDLLNAAWKANPVGLIATAIAVLIGLLVLLVTHWDKVKEAAKACIDWIANNLEWLGKQIAKIPGISALIKFFADAKPGTGTDDMYNSKAYAYNTSNSSNVSNKTTLAVTNNIYGSDSTSTAKKATDNMQSFYTRNLGGVIK